MSLPKESYRSYTQGDFVQWKDSPRIPPRSSFAFQVGKRIISQSIADGLVNPAQLSRVLDFGAGEGGSTLAFQESLPDAVIEAAEFSAYRASGIVKAGILPIEYIYRDGLIRLQEVQDIPSERYDLVIASMLGPWESADYFERLLAACRAGINPGGGLMVYSDSQTVKSLMAFCESNSVDFTVHSSGVFSQYGHHEVVHVSMPVKEANYFPGADSTGEIDGAVS